MLDALGLSDTLPRSRDPQALVRGYASLAQSGALVDHSAVMGGEGKLDGSLVSTPADLVAFMDALAQDDLISEESWAEMTDAHAISHPVATLASGYGLGLMELDTPWGPAWGHYGGVWPFTSLVFHFSEQDLTVAVITNAEVDGVLDLMHGEDILARLFED